MLNKLRQFLKAQNLIAPGSTVTCALSGGADSVAMTSRSWGMSKGASLAPQEIRIDFAVLPETKSQGLFHQIHKQVTFC